MMLAEGTSVHTRRILDWHLRRGCTITLVDYDDPLPAGTANYTFVPYPGAPGSRLVRALFGRGIGVRMSARVIARALRRIWRARQPDVVHLYQIDARAHHCDLAGIHPLVLSSWGTDINQHFAATADAAYRSRTAKALAASDLVIADARDVLDKCVQLAGRTTPTELLVLGIDTDLFCPGYKQEAAAWRASMAIPDEARILFSIRALTPRYGHHLVLEAFARACPSFLHPSILVFKAFNNQPGDAYQRELQALAGRLEIGAEVRWADAVDFAELPTLYAAADAIVNFPSIDGFPVTFLEAAACERPVITNQLPAYHGTLAETYFTMVEPGNVDRLADAFVQFVNRGGPCTEVLATARAEVEQNYSENRSADQLMDAYNRIVAVYRAREGDGRRPPTRIVGDP